MYRLSEATINNLEKSFGMGLADFDKMTADEERLGGKKDGKKAFL